MQKEKTIQAMGQLISPRDVQSIYTIDQPIDSLTDPVDDPCGTKCKGGSCNVDKALNETIGDILVF